MNPSQINVSSRIKFI